MIVGEGSSANTFMPSGFLNKHSLDSSLIIAINLLPLNSLLIIDI